jgi:hypothetical protein
MTPLRTLGRDGPLVTPVGLGLMGTLSLSRHMTVITQIYRDRSPLWLSISPGGC